MSHPYLIIKVAELAIEDSSEDTLQLGIIGCGHVDGREAGTDTLAEGIAATTGWCHSRQQLHVLHMLDLTLLAVIPTGKAHVV